MRFMLICKATRYSEAEMKQCREHNDAMTVYQRSLARMGALLAAEELPSSGSCIRIMHSLEGGEPEVMAGPLSIDQRLFAGFTLIDVKSEDEAVDWALRMPVPSGCGFFEIEMRKLEDNPDIIRNPSILAMEADLQDHLDMFKKI